MLKPYQHLLGTMPDRQIAEMAGCTPANVAHLRKRLGIPPFVKTKCKPIEYWDSLGKVRDMDLARQYKLAPSTVRMDRMEAGFDSGREEHKTPKVCKTYEYYDMLGKVPDYIIAAKYNTTSCAVRSDRIKVGLSAPRDNKDSPHYQGKIKSRSKKIANRIHAIENYLQAGLNQFQIAEKLGVTRQAVSAFIKDHDILNKQKPQNINWDELPLGKMPDAKIAKKLGIYPSTVATERKKRNIPSHRKSKFNLDDQPLGMVPDVEIARKLGINKETVARFRKRKGIPVFKKYNSIDWDTLPLGEMPDSEIARRFNLTQPAVTEARNKKNIPPYKDKRIDWDEQPLGLITDVELADRLGVAVTTVYFHRRKRGIQAYVPRTPSKEDFWNAQPLGEQTDKELANTLGYSKNNIAHQRIFRQIDTVRDSTPGTASSFAKKLNIHRTTLIAAIKQGNCKGWQENGVWYTTPAHVKRWVKKHFKNGLHYNGRKIWSNEEKETLKDLREKGLTTSEIAKKMLKSPRAVRIMLSRMGIKKDQEE